MDYKLLFKNPEGSQYKYSNMGKMNTNQWGNLSIGLQISRVKEAVMAAEREGKSFLNLSVFEDDAKVNQPQAAPQAKPEPQFSVADLDDELPPF